MIWLVLVIAIGLWGLWMITDRYLVDPDYMPVWHPPKCVGRRCAYQFLLYAAIFLFLLLPVWIKAPTVVTAVAEIFTRTIALLYWAFDRRPDFAIGPYGVYGLSRFKYHHVPWSKVDKIQFTQTRYGLGNQHSLAIHTTHQTKTFSIFQRSVTKPVVFIIAPIHGIDINDVISEITKFAPDKEIRKQELDERPYWMKW